MKYVVECGGRIIV